MIELPEITEFMTSHRPFDALSDEEIARTVRAVEIEYFRRGAEILAAESANNELHMIRNGAVELHDSEDELVARLGEGDYFGYISLLSGRPVRYRVNALEDTIIYHLPGAAFNKLRHANPQFDQYFTEAFAERLQTYVDERLVGEVATTRLRQLVQREPVVVAPDASIADAATRMAEKRVSALLICDNETLAGIVTDRDLRNRVVAARRAYEDPISTVMTPQPMTLDAEEMLADALLTMMRSNIHHLPVTSEGQPVGMVSLADLLRAESEHPIYMIGDVLKQPDPQSIANVCHNLPSLFLRMIDADATADQVGKVVTAVTDSVTKRLLMLGEQQLGTPPVPYAWLALGSQARQEQTVKTDQDNAIIMSDEATDADRKYFEELARFVSDGLALSGYPYCPGNVMATNEKWLQPLRVWKRYFDRWMTEPEPKALMYADIFFDLRFSYGEESLVDELKGWVSELARQNRIFLAMMARNAMTFTPPLGFFRQFVLERGGEHKETLNLKLNGVIPIVELARIHSLASGELRVNTRRRLRGAARRGRLNRNDAKSLEDALELIDSTRLNHQARQLRAGEQPDNYVHPKSLSPLARDHLKAAFGVVRTSQQALMNSFGLA